MNSFPGADLKMMDAMRADLQVFVQFLVENHVGALGTFGPKPFGNVALTGLAGSQLWLFGKSRFRRCAWRGRRDRWFNCIQSEGLFVEGGGRHIRLIHYTLVSSNHHAQPSRRKHLPL